jgi:hypothetical protein
MRLNEHDIQELHYITRIDNVHSIIKFGILSHNEMKRRRIKHQSVANPYVQSRRTNKVIPGGRKLHDYVNLYFNARNPMMYVILNEQDVEELCVLMIDKSVLYLRDVIISDENAARDLTRFSPSPDGLRLIEKEEVFSDSWNHPDPVEKHRLKGVMCAEILVPQRISPELIIGAYVSSDNSKKKLVDTGFDSPVTVNAYMFFQ